MLSVLVEQRDIDLVVTLAGPDGKKVVEVDSPNGSKGQESLFWVAEAAGEYQLEVRALDSSAAAGRYEVKVTELRAAREKDRRLVEAQRVFIEGTTFLAQGDMSAVVRKFEEALTLWVEAGEQSRTIVTLDTLVAACLELSEPQPALKYLEQRRALTRAASDEAEDATLLSGIARVFERKGDSDSAEALYRRALTMREKARGPAHRDVAESLNNLALVYSNKGDIGRALPLYQRSLTIAEKALGPEHADVGTVLNNLATLYFKRADYTHAEPLYRRVLAIREKTLGPEHPDLNDTLTNLGAIYHSKSEYDRAEPLYRRALAITEKAVGPERQEVATILDSLAQGYARLGDHVRAEPLYQRALTIREKTLGPEHPVVAQTLNRLAQVYEEKGDYARAESLYQRALAMQEKALGPEHPDVGESLVRLAGLYSEKGNYTRPESLYRRALAIQEKALGPGHSMVATTLNNLAELYLQRGDYGQAELLLKRSLAITEKVVGPGHPDVAALLNNLAWLYMEKGDYASAEPLHQRVLSIVEKAYGQEHPHVARALNGLAQIYVRKGTSASAEALYWRAAAISEKVYGPQHPNIAISLNGLAVLYGSRGDYDRAESLYRRSLAIAESLYGPEHPSVATTTGNIGSVAEAKGNTAEAEVLYQRALAIREKLHGPEHASVANSLNDLAGLYEAKGNFAEAVRLLARAQDIRESNLSLVLATGSERQKLRYLNTMLGETFASVSLHLRSAPADEQAMRLALTTVLRRKGRALDAASDQIAALRRRATPDDRWLLDQLTEARTELSNLRLGSSDSIPAAQRQAQAARLEAESEQLETLISQRSAEFRVQAQPVTPEAVQRALPNGAALIEIFAYEPYDASAKRNARWGAPRYGAYILRHNGAIAHVDWGEVAPIDRAVRTLREAVAYPGSRNVRAAARSLYELTMRSVLPHLGDAKQIFISPDGALNLVPFAALVDEENRYLIERYTLSYLTSGRDLLRLNMASQSGHQTVVIANPAFDAWLGEGRPSLGRASPGERGAEPSSRARAAPGRRSGDMERLRWDGLSGTAEEASLIKELLPGARVLTGRAATEGALKSVSAPRVLHLSTHGFFLTARPAPPVDKRSAAAEGAEINNALSRRTAASENPLLRSGLALAGANRRRGGAGDDGILTALEASALDLWGTKLVVLSACETGVGDINNGDGVYGLRRALVLAGAESQLMSLWQVDDAATRELMVRYYERLVKGEGRGEALRRIQLEMATRKGTAHPFYWASFIPIGDWRGMVDAK